MYWPKLIALSNRTHRERKEAYTKSLEQEVIQLRANEARILQETRTLYAELMAFKKLMTQHGVQLPATHGQAQHKSASTSISASDEEMFNLSIQFTSTKQKRRQICVYKQQHSASSTAFHSQAQSMSNDSSLQSPNCKSSLAVNCDPWIALTDPTAFFSPKSSKEQALNSPLNARISDLDLTTVGMEFVLT